jgi:predicted Zn-dependent protease
MQTDLEGFYMDGLTAERHRVRVRLTRAGLQILLEGGGILSWPLEEIRQPGNFFGGAQIRLERGGETPEVLLVHGGLFLKTANAVWPEPGKRFRAPERGRKWIRAAALSAAAAVAVVCGLYVWGIPALASFLAPRIPVAWEEKLGRSVVAQLAPPERLCTDTAQVRKVEEILAVLEGSVPDAPYSFRVFVLDNPMVNALAAPGGTIIVFRGLLDRTATAEEMAGVLAHEMQHILRRHATQAMLQQLSMKIIVAVAVGDAKGLSYGLEGAQLLGMLRYSRQYEEEADAGAVRMLAAAGIDPRGLASFFEAIEADRETTVRIPAYLSTHPDMDDRIRRLKDLAAGAPPPRTRLLPGLDWQAMHDSCKSGQTEGSGER